MSDLHVDYPQNWPRLQAWAEAQEEVGADVLIVAGDLSHKLEHVDRALGVLSSFAGPRLFVAGNHDIWIVPRTADESTDSFAKLTRLSDVARRRGFHPLEESNFALRGFTFVGTIGWYDYSFANPDLDVPVEEYRGKKWGDFAYMDGSYARWGVPDEMVVDRLVGRVAPRLAQAKGRVVFVSHHVPRREWVLRRGDASWDFFNAYMGSAKLERLLESHGVSRFVFGHTHRPVSLVEKGRFVINNPLGYPRQALTPLSRPFEVT